MSNDVLVKVEGVSKKFCRSLKRSMWYGVQDVSNELLGRNGGHNVLRKNEFWAVNDISFELRRGECLGLVGPNGAGKSSLLKMLNGLIKPDKGTIVMRGRVGALIELGTGFNPILTARENIYINGSVLGFTKKEIDQKFEAIVEFSELRDFIDTPVQSFSSGMKVRLGFAVAAQMEPDILLIDEVLAVGDVGFVAKCFNRISELMNSSAVIFVSHHMPNVFRLCSQIITLKEGETCYQGKDVAKGIERFFSFFSTTRSIDVFCGPYASLNRIEIESNGKQNVSSIKHGDEFRLHFYCFVDPTIEKFCLNMLIFDQNQNALIFSSSYFSDKMIRNSNGHNHVVVDLGKVNLSSGLYSIDVSINDRFNIDVLAQTQSMKQFRAHSDFVGYAPIQLQGTWSSESDQ